MFRGAQERLVCDEAPFAGLDDELPTVMSEARLRSGPARGPMASEPPTLERQAPNETSLATTLDERVPALAQTADPEPETTVRAAPSAAPPALVGVDDESKPPSSSVIAVFPATPRTVTFPDELEGSLAPSRPAPMPHPLAIVPSARAAPPAVRHELPPPPMVSSLPPPMVSSLPPRTGSVATAGARARRGISVRSLVVLVLVLAFFSGMATTIGFETFARAVPVAPRAPHALAASTTKLSVTGGAVARREAQPDPAPPRRRRLRRRPPVQPAAVAPAVPDEAVAAPPAADAESAGL
jgi:hypothetical protein